PAARPGGSGAGPPGRPGGPGGSGRASEKRHGRQGLERLTAQHGRHLATGIAAVNGASSAVLGSPHHTTASPADTVIPSTALTTLVSFPPATRSSLGRPRARIRLPRPR